MLFVKKLSETSVLPVKGSTFAAGFDLASAQETVVPAHGKAIVKTDLAVATPLDCYARIAPRSGLAWKNHIDVGAGVVDADYRGNVGVILFNFSDQDFPVAPGDRVAQLILEKIDLAVVEEVAELPDTQRGAGGFGSTGVSAALPAADGAVAAEASACSPADEASACSPASGPVSGKLLVKRLSETAVLPVKGSEYAAGFDLASAHATVVPAHGKAIVKTDLSIATPLDCYARIAPRSGLAWKNHIDVGAGVVDADYRGNVGVILFNFSDQDFPVAPGDRVAQLILEKIDLAVVEEVAELPDTQRGAGGFGSTGVSAALPAADGAAAAEASACSPGSGPVSGKLLVKRLSETAVLPVKGSEYAAGFDLASAHATVVPARGKAIVKTDLAVATPLDCYARIAPRSGLAWKNHIDVGAGVVDADYRGNVGVILFNFSDQDFPVAPGDRVAQLILEKIDLAAVEEVAELPDTQRGAGGFGSTGVSAASVPEPKRPKVDGEGAAENEPPPPPSSSV